MGRRLPVLARHDPADAPRTPRVLRGVHRPPQPLQAPRGATPRPARARCSPGSWPSPPRPMPQKSPHQDATPYATPDFPPGTTPGTAPDPRTTAERPTLMMLRYALQTVRHRKGRFPGRLPRPDVRGRPHHRLRHPPGNRTARHASAPSAMPRPRSWSPPTRTSTGPPSSTRRARRRPSTRPSPSPSGPGSRRATADGTPRRPRRRARRSPNSPSSPSPLTRAGSGDRSPPTATPGTSAALTPYTLATGTALPQPRRHRRRPGSRRARRPRARRPAHRPVHAEPRARTASPASRRPAGDGARHQTSLFFSAAEARRLAAHPGQVTRARRAARGQARTPPSSNRPCAQALHGTTAQVSRATSGAPSSSWTRPPPGSSSSAWAARWAAPRCSSPSSWSSGPSRCPSSSATGNSHCCAPSPPPQGRSASSSVARRCSSGAAAGIAGALAGLPLGAWLHGRFVALGAVPATLRAHGQCIFPCSPPSPPPSRRLGRRPDLLPPDRPYPPGRGARRGRAERGRPAWGRVRRRAACCSRAVLSSSPYSASCAPSRPRLP